MSYFDPPDKTQSVLSPLHPALPSLPERLRLRPVDARGYPVPWFVEWFHPDGTVVKGEPGANDHPDFRVVSALKMSRAVRQNLCWVCGGALGKYLAFTIGPMCAVNRTSGEPPAHRECAEFSARACPFLTKPQVERREGGVPEEATIHPAMLNRNPGVVMVWITLSYSTRQSGFNVIFRMGEPEEVMFFCEGRPATRAEIMHSIDTGMPFLREQAEKDGEEGLKLLQELYTEALRLVPA